MTAASRWWAMAPALMIAAGAWIAGEPLWLAAKARLAAELIDRAWREHLREGGRHRPWGHADTWPVARLEVPRLELTRTILAGASGSSLAFGPGHLDGTARPNGPGTCAVAGHRDGAFAFLRRLRVGDRLWLATRDERRRYEVTDVAVVDERDASALEEVSGRRLVLITCYPFGGLTGGSTARYVVICDETAVMQNLEPS